MLAARSVALPAAAADSYTVAPATTLNVPAPGVLANDTDAGTSGSRPQS